MSDDENIQFAHLNETNYFEWAMRMEAQLIRLGLWDVVMYETDTGVEEDLGEVEKAWQRRRTPGKMAEARAEIILRVEDSQLPHMRSRDPMEIWQSLAQTHTARGLTMRLTLRRQFMRLTKHADETMMTWVGRVKSFSFRLEAIGVEVTDEDRILTLTNGLDDSYEALIISIDTILAPDIINFDYVVGRLLIEEMCRGDRGAGKVKPKTASQNTVGEKAVKDSGESYQHQTNMSPGGSRRGGGRNDPPQQIGPDAKSGSEPPPQASDLPNSGKMSKPTPVSFRPTIAKQESKRQSPSRISAAVAPTTSPKPKFDMNKLFSNPSSAPSVHLLCGGSSPTTRTSDLPSQLQSAFQPQGQAPPTSSQSPFGSTATLFIPGVMRSEQSPDPGEPGPEPRPPSSPQSMQNHCPQGTPSKRSAQLSSPRLSPPPSIEQTGIPSPPSQMQPQMPPWGSYPSPGLTSPPLTPSGPAVSNTRLNANSNTFVPRGRSKVTVKRADGTPVNPADLKTTTNRALPPVGD